MPALNFQARFADLVAAGAKTQTIRKRRKDGRDPKPGDRLVLYTGMRTEACRKLGIGEVSDVVVVTILRRGAVLQDPLTGDDDVRGPAEGRADTFAEDDGFADFDAMAEWFESTHGLPFHGLLIRWRLATTDEV